MYLSNACKKAIESLEKAGFEAYAVGGCVRDSILGKIPTDYDITTSALPDETKAVFKNEHVIETGIKHGTVTVLIEHQPLEITTFRIDKNYSDNRHPEKVEFTRSLKDDLARRDFTINALAYSDKTGIIDEFGGISDLEHGTIRAVGEADLRFNEDALRIMRALRFASVLGFEIEEKTAESIHKNRELLKNISIERFSSELIKLLCGKGAEKILLEFSDVLFVLIPELSVLKDFNQLHFRHDKTAFEHTAAVIKNTPPKPVLRLAALFHDIAKPRCLNIDENGIGHYYGHAPIGAFVAKDILTRLKLDNETKSAVEELVRLHENRFPAEPKAIKRLLGKIGAERYFDLLELMRADDLGKKAEYFPGEEFYENYRRIAKEIIKKSECFSLSDLAVNGKDLISAGIPPSPKMGEILQSLLEAVIDETVPNEKAALLDFVKKLP